MHFRSQFLNQFQAKRIKAHLDIIWLQSTASGIPSLCFTEKEKCAHAKDLWKNGSTGSTSTWFWRPKKTHCVKTLELFEKSSSKYITLRFCKFSCMSVEKRTIYNVDCNLGGERSLTNRSNYRVAPTIWLLAGSAGRHTAGFHEWCS